MLYSKIALGALAAFGSLAAAHPLADGDLLKRVVTPDETCGDVFNGANHGYTCATGDCCSQYVCSTFFKFPQGIRFDRIPVLDYRLLLILLINRVTAEPLLIIAAPGAKQPLG